MKLLTFVLMTNLSAIFANLKNYVKSLLIMKGQKRNRGARKMNLFTSLVEL